MGGGERVLRFVSSQNKSDVHTHTKYDPIPPSILWWRVGQCHLFERQCVVAQKKEKRKVEKNTTLTIQFTKVEVIDLILCFYTNYNYQKIKLNSHN